MGLKASPKPIGLAAVAAAAAGATEGAATEAVVDEELLLPESESGLEPKLKPPDDDADGAKPKLNFPALLLRFNAPLCSNFCGLGGTVSSLGASQAKQ